MNYNRGEWRHSILAQSKPPTTGQGLPVVQAELALHHVSKTFRENSVSLEAVRDVSFTANPGEFITLIGPSGSGKSTVFNLITGLLRPDSGEIMLGSEVINGRTGLVGYMPQRDLLLPWRSVLDNVTLDPEIARKTRQDARKR